jgi:hypothetical protein
VTTLIYVENVLGSGQVVKLSEDFGDYSVSRELKPGEHTRLVVSSFKSLSIEEVPVTQSGREVAAERTSSIAFPSPRSLARRYG